MGPRSRPRDDDGDLLTYSLDDPTADDNGKFEIDRVTGQLKVASGHDAGTLRSPY